jgi:hypothetical protein
VARPLEFKRRVQLSERDLDLKPPRARASSTPFVLGVVAYGCAFGLAWGVSTNRLPIADTFEKALAPPAEAKTKPRARVDSVQPAAALETSEGPEPGAPEAVATAPLPDDPEPVAPAAPKPPPLTELVPLAQPLDSPPATNTTPKLGPATSCEAVLEAYSQNANQNAPPDLGAKDYGSILNKGDYLDRCGVPTTTAVDVCVAVQNGRALGVTITTTPSNGKLDRCLSRVIRGVSFPSHPRLDMVRTRFSTAN